MFFGPDFLSKQFRRAVLNDRKSDYVCFCLLFHPITTEQTSVDSSENYWDQSSSTLQGIYLPVIPGPLCHGMCMCVGSTLMCGPISIGILMPSPVYGVMQLGHSIVSEPSAVPAFRPFPEEFSLLKSEIKKKYLKVDDDSLRVDELAGFIEA